MAHKPKNYSVSRVVSDDFSSFRQDTGESKITELKEMKSTGISSKKEIEARDVDNATYENVSSLFNSKDKKGSFEDDGWSFRKWVSVYPGFDLPDEVRKEARKLVAGSNVSFSFENVRTCSKAVDIALSIAKVKVQGEIVWVCGRKHQNIAMPHNMFYAMFVEWINSVGIVPSERGWSTLANLMWLLRDDITSKRFLSMAVYGAGPFGWFIENGSTLA